MDKHGFLISFEGGEACGKDTQIKLFADYLQQQKYDFLMCREPGGTDVGEQIREILLHSKAKLSAQTEFLLFSASRSKLVEDVVKPALSQGKIVVMNRFFDSSFAYQGTAGVLNLKDIEAITNFAIGGNTCGVGSPDLTILLDIDYDRAMARKAKDPLLAQLDRMESKGKEYHLKVREGFLLQAKKHKDRIVIVDASQSVEEVHKQIVKIFEERFQKSKNASTKNKK